MVYLGGVSWIFWALEGSQIRGGQCPPRELFGVLQVLWGRVSPRLLQVLFPFVVVLDYRVLNEELDAGVGSAHAVEVASVVYPHLGCHPLEGP